MSKVRVRVEAKRISLNASKQEKEQNFQRLWRAFNKACKEYGVIQEYNEREYFTRKCDIRRKKKEMRLAVTRGEIKVDDGEERNGWE